MTLTKHKMVAEIGRRTRLKNREIEAVIEALMEVWIEELVNDGRIELENFVVLEVQTIRRNKRAFDEITAKGGDQPQQFRQVVIHSSKHLRNRLKDRV